eukprot:scaffold16670_cov110-Isochrysis_galbana.AAC.4
MVAGDHLRTRAEGGARRCVENVLSREAPPLYAARDSSPLVTWRAAASPRAAQRVAARRLAAPGGSQHADCVRATGRTP